jgi:uncharacterized protein (UPF0548 family)
MTDDALTDPAAAVWGPTPARFRRYERTIALGSGEEVWRRAADDVRHWRVKTRSGFRVEPPHAAAPGPRPVITVGVGVLRIREPVEVIATVDTDVRVGFAYGTLPGHPVDGEEAFIVHRDGARVDFTVRSLTRAASVLPWRALYPALRAAQAIARFRYRRALR